MQPLDAEFVDQLYAYELTVRLDRESAHRVAVTLDALVRWPGEARILQLSGGRSLWLGSDPSPARHGPFISQRGHCTAVEAPASVIASWLSVIHGFAETGAVHHSELRIRGKSFGGTGRTLVWQFDGAVACRTVAESSTAGDAGLLLGLSDPIEVEVLHGHIPVWKLEVFGRSDEFLEMEAMLWGMTTREAALLLGVPPAQAIGGAWQLDPAQVEAATSTFLSGIRVSDADHFLELVSVPCDTRGAASTLSSSLVREDESDWWYAVRLRRWKTGLPKISLVRLIQSDIAGGLWSAKRVMELYLENASVTVFTRSPFAVRALIGSLASLDIDAELVARSRAGEPMFDVDPSLESDDLDHLKRSLDRIATDAERADEWLTLAGRTFQMRATEDRFGRDGVIVIRDAERTVLCISTGAAAAWRDNLDSRSATIETAREVAQSLTEAVSGSVLVVTLQGIEQDDTWLTSDALERLRAEAAEELVQRRSDRDVI